MKLDKYNKPVPRYTSFPPANHFTSEFAGSDYRELIVASNNEKPAHIGIYVHIPFCRQRCFYCGCNSWELKDEKLVDTYMSAVKKEMQMVFELLDKNRLVSLVHFGGGTPNSIPAGYITEILDMVYAEFDFIEAPEIAIECNPAYLDKHYIKELKEAGFNRFSLGVQDLDPTVLEAVNRKPPLMPLKEVTGYLRKDTAASVNMDFIYGLPKQTVDSFTETIKKAVELKPDRLVTFSYAHVPWLKEHQLKVEKAGLPPSEEKANMFLSARKLLDKSGYESIGMDHFVLPGDELYRAQQKNMLHRNFQGYCSRRTTGQVYAFGVSAISQLSGAYSQNTKDMDKYTEGIEKGEFPVEKGYRLSDREKVIREIITRLMCNYRLNWVQLQDELGDYTNDVREFADEKKLEEFAADSLIEYNRNGIRVTKEGMFFVRNIAASFDPFYKVQENKYSKPV